MPMGGSHPSPPKALLENTTLNRMIVRRKGVLMQHGERTGDTGTPGGPNRQNTEPGARGFQGPGAPTDRQTHSEHR